MAKPLKTNGLVECRALRARTNRQYGLERIAMEDRDYIVDRLNEIETRIIEMKEEDGGESWQ